VVAVLERHRGRRGRRASGKRRIARLDEHHGRWPSGEATYVARGFRVIDARLFECHQRCRSFIVVA
jgi:hypothetical protein